MCAACAGTGGVRCFACEGSGQRSGTSQAALLDGSQRRDPLGRGGGNPRECIACKGAGMLFCAKCSGSGYAKRL